MYSMWLLVSHQVILTLNERTHDLVIHFCRLLVSESLAVQSFQPITYLQVFTLNPLRVKLAPDVFFIRQHVISTEVVGAPEGDIET